VEANKAMPFWRRTWVLSVAGGVVLAMLGVFFGPQAWSAISTAIANQPIAATEAPISGDATIVPAINVTEPVTVTPDQAATDLATATESAQAFYEPILAYTESETPTYEDDFSTSNDAWGNTSAGIPISSMIYGGILKIDESRGGELSFPTNKLLDGSDFVFKFDFAFESNTDERLAFRFRAATDQSSYYEIKFIATVSRGLRGLLNAWQFYEVNDNETRLTIPGSRFLNDEGNEILIIVQQEHLAVFVNQDLILERDDIAFAGQGNSLIAENLNNYIRVDNVKFWNLDLDATDHEP